MDTLAPGKTHRRSASSGVANCALVLEDELASTSARGSSISVNGALVDLNDIGTHSRTDTMQLSPRTASPRKKSENCVITVDTENGLPVAQYDVSSSKRPLSSDSNTTSTPYSRDECGVCPSSPTPSTDSSTPVLHMYDTEKVEERTTVMPPDRFRCLVAFGMLFCAALSNEIVLAYIHERVPDTKPLPDLFFQNTPYMPGALKASEIAMLVNTIVAFSTCILNKHRFTLLKRLLIVSSMLYGGRAATMLVTQVPVADPKYYCAPKSNETGVLLVLERALSLISGFGLSIGGKHVLCGDYIYSGHTVVLVHSYLIVRWYTPRHWRPLHWVSWCMSAMGVICLLLSRGHYTVDVVLAYWITTRVFSSYHTMCNVRALRSRSSANLMSRYCWYPLFRYMEHDVPCKVPLRFEWPLPWPRTLVRSTSKTNMY